MMDRKATRSIGFAGELVLIATLLVAAVPATAQQFEAYGGYQYQRFVPSTGTATNLNGWLVGAQRTLARYDRTSVAVAVDLGGVYTTQGGVNLHHYVYLAGPRMARRFGRLGLYGHAMLGGAQLSASEGTASDSTASFAFDAGGGAELHLGDRWGLRPVQLDWLATNHAHSPQNTFRYSSMITWRFR
jgi:hypothetical protein